MHVHQGPLLVLSLLSIGACFQPGTPTALSEGGTTDASDSSVGPAVDPDSASSGPHGTTSGSASETAGIADDADTTAAASSTGAGEPTDDPTTGAEACTGIGPAGLPGVNPRAIWIANSPQGTISKIDTVTMIEQGRYLTREDGAGNPSRTAVSLDGDVVVADRLGGLTKIYGNPSDCTDVDGDGVVTTSSDGQFLPWAAEECRAWHLPLTYTSQRPVAWTAGQLDEQLCERVGEKVWTAGVIDGMLIEVLLVDGETGLVEQSVQVPEITPDAGSLAPIGFYGGAVDSAGNFWVSMPNDGFLARFDRNSLDYDYWPQPISSYGMTLDPSGHVFLCSGPHTNNEGVARFDPTTETWLIAPGANGSGCVVDGEGRLWLANDPMIAVDTTTLAVVKSIDLPEYVHGVGVDFDGMIWGIGFSFASTNAYRVDPETGAISLFGQLVAPYTYSDMTGFVLASTMQ